MLQESKQCHFQNYQDTQQVEGCESDWTVSLLICLYQFFLLFAVTTSSFISC